MDNFNPTALLTSLNTKFQSITKSINSDGNESVRENAVIVSALALGLFSLYSRPVLTTITFATGLLMNNGDNLADKLDAKQPSDKKISWMQGCSSFLRELQNTSSVIEGLFSFSNHETTCVTFALSAIVSNIFLIPVTLHLGTKATDLYQHVQDSLTASSDATDDLPKIVNVD